MMLVALALEVVLVARGLPAACGVATDPQGAPFVSAEKHVARVVARNALKPFAETDGRPCGLAFDAAGDLYVADLGRKALLKVTPWGEITVAAERCENQPLKEPAQVAVGAGGEVYFTDAGTGRVCRLEARGSARALVSGLDGPRGVTVSGEHVFVAEGTGTIWRLPLEGSTRARFARVDGAAAALLLDEKGHLYAGHGSRVSVFSPAGELIETYAVPGAEVTGLAFGGLDLQTVYVAERSTGALYKLRAPHRSQRLPWEPDRAVRITDPPDGAILNRHDGERTPQGLRVIIEGASRVAGPVRVNGVAAEVRDGRFRAPVTLRDRQTRITAEAGGLRDTIQVLWDRDSEPRYRFSIDDNIWFLRDIAQHAATYESIFDNPYLAFWREMHDRYGARLHFNIYWETEGFNLSQMPAKFRDEWRRNADWLRLTFHARANDPDRPYIHASAEQIREDYRRVTREIERFAGRELLSPFTTVHWGETTRAAARALRRRAFGAWPATSRRAMNCRRCATTCPWPSGVTWQAATTGRTCART